MKCNKYKSLIVAIVASSSTVAMAQEEQALIDSLAAGQQTIQVAFRQVKQSDLLGGVSSINVRELMDKNYFYQADENLQAFVGGWNGKSLWGMDDKLVLIDGVPRDINNIKPEEIESISFLKGANAVALYGSHGTKGVILVTTKRGKNEDIKISARANTGWFVDKSYPEYLGSAEYMHYYNQALQNDGSAPLYSDEDIYYYALGENRYRYPDVNFYSSDMLKKAYNRTDVSAEIQGGNENARFYTNLAYYRFDSQFKKSVAKNNYTDRFDIRGNVDIDITDYIAARVDASATFYNKKSAQGEDYWKQASTFRPNRISPFIPVEYVDETASEAQDLIKTMSNFVDGQFLAGTNSDKTNVFADMYVGGKKKWTSRQLQFSTGLDFNLDPLVQGLSFHAQFAIDYATSYTNKYEDKYATYEVGWANFSGKDQIVSLTKIGDDQHTGQQNVDDSKSNSIMALSAHIDYERTFGDHNVGAMVVVNGFQKQNSGQYHYDADASLGFNVRYDFAKRYYADLSLAMPHSSKLPKETWNGVSPTATLGWNVARESFLEGGIFDDLMVSVSASQLNSDTDIKEYYMYDAKYDNGGSWNWDGSTSTSAYVSKRGMNSDLDFIKRKEFSANVRASLLNRALTFEASVFKNSMEGKIITTETTMPSYFVWKENNNVTSSFVSNVNYENDERVGMDFSVNYNKTFGEVNVALGVNGTYYKTKATKRDDTQYEYDYQKREGKDVDALWGYECLGFFQNEADIAASPSQTSFGQDIKPGDLKYKDQNGDGVIDKLDQVNLGAKGEYGDPFTLGVNLTAKYKGFTFFALATGKFGAIDIRNKTYWWIKSTDKYSAVVRNSWTPETAATADYPRLTAGNGANNYVESDFWTYKKDRFDIAKVQLTYDLPSSIFENNKIVSNLQVYVSGSNLLTFSKERDELELKVGEGQAPDTRFYNLGVKVTF